MAFGVVQSWALEICSRRLLLHRSSPAPWITARPSRPHDRNFEPNAVMILAVLLCALICALGLSSLVRCALRRSTQASFPDRAGRPAEIGLRKKALRRLPSLVYSVGLRVTGSVPECAICLSEFASGEQIRVLPKCHHGFHLECIDRWLTVRSSCPTCRRSMLPVCEKTSTSSCAGASRPVLVPLEPEGLIAACPRHVYAAIYFQ